MRDLHDDPLFQLLRRELESSPLSEPEMARLRTRWLKKLRAIKRQLTLRDMAREIAAKRGRS